MDFGQCHAHFIIPAHLLYKIETFLMTDHSIDFTPKCFGSGSASSFSRSFCLLCYVRCFGIESLNIFIIAT